jgi:branched-chain amino acid transport system substrate-binding protein
VRRHWLASGFALILGMNATAFAGETPVKIGVLGDSSSINAAIGGKGSVEAVKMAVEDAGPVLGAPVEVVSADHQNKADIGSNIARRWFDVEGIDVIADLPNSAVAIAVSQVARDKHKIALIGAGSSDITGQYCSPYSAQWVYDSYALGKVLGTSVTKEGGDSWFFITVDYTFGHALERDTSQFVKAAGGQVLGSVRAPLNTSDFSSFLLQAQASGAKVIAFANTGNDTVNAIKQGREFGMNPDGAQQFVALNAYISDVTSMGLAIGQGVQLTEPFYWDQDDQTRAWSKRFEERMGHKPTAIQAGAYSEVSHYLKAVKAAGSKDADKVMAKMKEIPINDFMTHDGKLRDDGRVERDMYLFKVKTPAESKGPDDLYKLIARIPAEQVARPLSEGGCPLVK